MTGDLTIIDADGHIYEDMAAWAAYMPKGWTGPRPALLVGDDGIERFIIGDVYAMPARDTNQMGKMSIDDAMTPRDRGLGKASTSGRRLADAAPGGCDPKARLEVMEVEGIAVSILFPSFALAGLPAMADPKLASYLAAALNDWTAEQFGSAEPGRLVAVASIPLHDPKFAAHELERCVRQLNVLAGWVSPAPVMGRVINHPDYDVVWAKAAELGVPICPHHGSGGGATPALGRDRNTSWIGAHAMGHPFEAMGRDGYREPLWGYPAAWNTRSIRSRRRIGTVVCSGSFTMTGARVFYSPIRASRRFWFRLKCPPRLHRLIKTCLSVLAWRPRTRKMRSCWAAPLSI